MRRIRARGGTRRPAMALELLDRNVPGGCPRGNLLVQGDNLEVARLVYPEYAGKVDLLYLDPPFASGQDYQVSTLREGSRHRQHAYRDRFPGGLAEYREWMAPRLEAACGLLASDGALYLHCDTRACHVLRCLLDEILGERRFRAQIAWRRTTSHPDAGFYGAVHDVILFYADRSHSMTPVRAERDPELVRRYYRYRDPDGRRFMSDNLTGAGSGPARAFGERGLLEPPHGRHWLHDQQGVDRLLAEGRIFWTRNGVPRLKKYLDEAEGVPVGDLWLDIQPLRSWHRLEATGYATQKPEALLERIVVASSRPGDLVADLFCGSGTTVAVAERLGRRWLGCDVGSAAVQATRRRLLKMGPRQTFSVCRVDRPPGLPLPQVSLHEGRIHLSGLEGLDLASWRPRVDCWAVQWEPEGEDFLPDWWGLRDEAGCLPLFSAPVPVPLEDSNPRVRVYGVEGEVATVWPRGRGTL